MAFASKNWVIDLVKKCLKSDKTKEEINNYSTDEIVCGTWIDGKPIYRKYITDNTLPTDIDIIIKTDRYIETGTTEAITCSALSGKAIVVALLNTMPSNKYNIQVTRTSGGSNWANTSVLVQSQTTTTFNIYTWNNSSSSEALNLSYNWEVISYEYVLEYTKTTD